MIPQLQAMWSELEQESANTRRALERVPADKLAWKPHPKSMSLGQLALEVARVPAAVCGMARLDGLDAATVDFTPASPKSREEILAAFESSLAEARKAFEDLDAQRANAMWRLDRSGTKVMEMPRLALLRVLLLNHLIHHRGQLTVYLRLLDVPVPAMYGRSADEQPFG